MDKNLKSACLRIKKIGLCGQECPVLKDNKCPELKNINKNKNKGEDVPDFLKNMFGGL